MSLWAFRFLLWHVCVYLVQPQLRLTFLIPWHLGDLTFLAALLCHAISVTSENRPPIRLGAATMFCIVLLCLAFMANLLGAYQTNSGWNSTLDLIVKNCVVIIIFEAIVDTPERVLGVLMTLAVASLWWFKAGVRGLLGGGGYLGARIMGPNVGLLQGPNEFGIFMTALIPLLLGLSFMAVNRPWLKRVSLIFAAIGVLIVLQTGSRAGLICLVVLALVSVPYLSVRRILPLLVFACIAVYGVLHIDAENMVRFKTIPQAIANAVSGETDKPYETMDIDEKSTEDRRRKNRDTWKLIKAHSVIGAGLNPDVGAYPEEFSFARGVVHNEILMAGRQMGYPGIALLFSMYGYIFFRGFSIYRRARRAWPAMSMLGWSLSATSVILLIGGAFSTFVWNIIFLLILLMTSRASRMLDQFSPPSAA